MARSAKKCYFIDASLHEKVLRAQKEKSRKPIKTHSRRSTVIPAMVGLVMAVHNGRAHVPVLVVESMVGEKLGVFAPTRTFHGHAGNKKADKKK